MLQEIGELLLTSDQKRASAIARKHYPFQPIAIAKRNYTAKFMMEIFHRDGFIDRYFGERLYNPGYLRLLHNLLPSVFPYHRHGKTGACHDIFWDKLPSIDHKIPLNQGGKDTADNIVTTSSRRNLSKSNATPEQVGWQVRACGSIKDWDGCSVLFMKLCEVSKPDDKYILRWLKATEAFDWT